MWLIEWFCMSCIYKIVKSMTMYWFMCVWVEVVLLCYPGNCEQYRLNFIWLLFSSRFMHKTLQIIKLDIFIFLSICLLFKNSFYINCFEYSKLEHWCWKILIFSGNSQFSNLFHNSKDFWKFWEFLLLHTYMSSFCIFNFIIVGFI